jgi:hypothetical protein
VIFQGVELDAGVIGLHSIAYSNQAA